MARSHTHSGRLLRSLLALLLLLPLLVALFLSQLPRPLSIDLATEGSDPLLRGFFPPESQDGLEYRWARPGATVALPGGPQTASIEIFAAAAPGVESLSLQVSGQAPLDLSAGAGFRRYRLYLPIDADNYGWSSLRIDGVPATASRDPRPLLLALAEVRLLPRDAPGTQLPAGVALVLLLVPAVVTLAGWLAGLPRAPAILLGTSGGLLLAWLWHHNPLITRPLLLDIGMLATTADIWHWWLAISGLGLAALPLNTVVFRRLPLAGYPFARGLGLLLCGWLAWLLAMADWLPFGRSSVLLAAAGLLLIGLLLWLRWRPALPPPAERRALLRGLLGYELLFALALSAGVWMRWHGAVGPAIYGTEKPMELAFLSGILRSPAFPPHDPWFGGYPINYYYLGYVLIAGLQVLTGTGIGAAFNLGTAVIFALTALMLGGLTTSLAAMSWRQHHAGPLPRRLGSTAVLALLLVLFAANQMGALQLLLGSWEARALSGPQMLSALGARMNGAEQIPIDAPPNVAGVPTRITPDDTQSFDWFRPSRAVYDDIQIGPGQYERRYTITEFPFFSFYLGDLHPHVLSLPFSLLALALALAAAVPDRRSLRPGQGGEAPPESAVAAVLPDEAWPCWLPRLVISGVVLGCLYAINSWDAPIYALLFSGATLLGRRRPVPAARDVLLAGLVAGLAVLPFLLSFVPPAGPGADADGTLPFLRTFALASHHTSLYGFLIIFGLFFAIVLAYALASHRRGRLVGGGLVLVAAIAGGMRGFPLLALLPLSLLLAWWAWQSREHAARAFALWTIAVGALFIFAADSIYVRDHQEASMPRMITVFKFYYQAWLIWGSIAAFAVYELLRPPVRRFATLLWAMPTTLLLVGALAYPLATLSRGEAWRPGERTLDGLTYLRREAPAEAAAMDWLASNADPTALVLTAFCDCDYDEIGRVAAVTGLQSMLGWLDGHETLWRSGSAAQLAEIGRRAALVPELYRSNDVAWTRQMLADYNIRYVYIGPTERRLHGGTGLLKFGEFMEPVFVEEGVAIYEMTGNR